ncbi:glycerophosphodiester phosphodiesterase family protein [Mycobacterium shimoidei]|uniref:glycerophosphodiester phosphodiesterase family protein n=1 Tax=Mycobacterium shimoidei TaxID=29313 RepID=UPI0008490E61|nr:glycerophosphodiester phosphodiesterase family protein [Mycobacterium shimoidei]MCV7259485.1 glycerophosphodiester phosphodiesterase [Mycobacterium shimoidei]ODR14646.1 glycerophosphodiester phosphodiesterase [Mycobacterium shimoidei]ORW81011.1 glycerophosphodiester phosphodiesterase [Mycobacterium shimoidei]
MRLRRRVLVLAVVVVLGAHPTATAQSSDFDVVAHQGGASALEIGVSTLEFDIGITKDHQPVVWHDQDIHPLKCTDRGPVSAADPEYPYVGKLVHELTLAQVRTLDCGGPIATLPEIFALSDSYHAEVRYDIETKVDPEEPSATAAPDEFVDVIVAAASAAGKIDRIEIQSFDWRTLVITRQLHPSIPVVTLWNQTTWRPGSPWLAGIDPAVVGDPVIAARMIGASIISPVYSLVDAALVERAHAVGLKVLPWTVNEADDMHALIAAGVDGIITDYPAVLRTVMAELGMPAPAPAHR